MKKTTPTPEWFAKYEEVKDLLVAPTNYAKFLDATELRGRKVFRLEMGEISCPSGELVVCDPLTFIDRALPYLQKVPQGKHKIETLVIQIDEDLYRYLFSRVKFTDAQPVVYRLALNGTEELEGVDADSFFGFDVDAGLATVVDVKTRDTYCKFVDKFYEQNPDANIYNDFFAAEFKKSVAKNPLYQRSEGDWIDFTIPDSDFNIHMIQAGFGDGTYPVYFGYDAEGNLCDLVMEYIFMPSDDELE